MGHTKVLRTSGLEAIRRTGSVSAQSDTGSSIGSAGATADAGRHPDQDAGLSYLTSMTTYHA